MTKKVLSYPQPPKKLIAGLPVRPPAVSGAFYPSQPNNLLSMVETYLSNAKVESRPNAQILIVPHAGYVYSGQVAAWGFKAVENLDIKTVVLVGNSHNFPGGVMFYPHAYFQTPMGYLETDRQLTDKLVKSDESFKVSADFHSPEHSLEVQLPFLQATLKTEFKIVPILLGTEDRATAEKLALALAKNLEFKNTLVVISSDLTHYPSYDDSLKADEETINAIETGGVSEFEKTIEQSESSAIKNLETAACGAGAIKVGLYMAKEIGADKISLLNRANSGDTSGDYSRVVGYASIIFETGKFPKEMTAITLAQEDKTELLKIARGSVEFYLNNKELPNVISNSPNLQKKQGAFVTIRENEDLRGCIGVFEADKPLYQMVSDMALSAGFSDPRFNPLSKEELKQLNFEISVLSPLKRVYDENEIEIGKHGVEVVNGNKRGVYLPQVATENGWSKEHFLQSLCEEKSGIGKDCWKNPDTEVYTFTAEVFQE